MRTRHRNIEPAVWGALALAGGLAAAWIDQSATAVQATVLILMLVTFALTLPGRAPVLVVAIAATVGLAAGSALLSGAVNAGIAIAIVPALIGAAGGRGAGRLLETATSRLTEAPAGDGPWRERPLTTRFLLGVALVLIAQAGLPALLSGIRAAGHHSPEWLALVWQIMTLLGWIGVAPLLLRTRVSIGGGLRPREALRHAALVVVLSALHVAALLACSRMLFIPLMPSWQALARVASSVYLPLDALAYLTIVTLGYVSNAERLRRDAAQLEAALRTESLDSRLTALRARLNPHFLFNALNSVHALVRAGKIEETSRLVEGLTALLRYVLDERRATLPLREELGFVREYLAVQQVRFGDRLRYDVECDPEVANAMVPQLVLQPIVENAVEHGVSRSLGGGFVRVTATRSGETLHVVVTDDGQAERVANGESSFGIGLASTRERLDALHGARARLSFDRPATGGTRVEIVLPFMSEGESAPRTS